jgi:chaperonin GroEL
MPDQNLVDNETNSWNGLNYKDLTVIDFKEAGIIDPKKVTRVALENAASVAGTILTTDAAVVEKARNEDAPPQQQWDPNGIM